MFSNGKIDERGITLYDDDDDVLLVLVDVDDDGDGEGVFWLLAFVVSLDVDDDLDAGVTLPNNLARSADVAGLDDEDDDAAFAG
jgi:hypothetical protein